ncbi:NAD(P)H-hydrate dehydratase [Mangrovihabitans endophyticus]|uniref:Bifunctional NAD(P)H-hydrate repair enzyme n=1 Tax=Mangrovihabitans endophyticus TaxID=1751298 RepID=A0A8J3FPF4_9ACTN|nr:NAD(P)H-hydrate dehydratase [Mangrovihabitans endophyticus]GGK92547.1 bifunctional NAD(P)H-hydrate repair enzyme [Mangrovihabitans endophyticus]
MRQAWRVADVRSAEKALMATVPEGALMQRAAAGLARRCALMLGAHGGVYGARVLLLVGSGDNGGDTLFAGARLAARGAQVSALLLDPDRAHPGGLRELRRLGGRTVHDLPERCDLVLDGIVGIGASGSLRPRAAELVAALAERRAPVVAVDVPSGVAVDTGDVPGAAVTADVTVTFGCLKPAHVVGPAAAHAGIVDVVDIGLGATLRADPAVRIPDAADIAAWWPRPGPASDKYSRGVVGVATGSATYPGAALLSVSGALAGPVGMVRYAGSARDDVVRAHPSVVTADRVSDAGRVQAWVCGSGLGTDETARTEVRGVLASPLPVLLDADALTLLVDGRHAEDLRRNAPLVVTPHDGEFRRLAGEAPGADRMGAACKLAAWINAVVLLKGDRTVVATPSGQVFVNPTGSPALATAGSGDVLAGLLGSLLAGGLPAERAAVAAAFVHGLAGRRAAERGPVTSADVAAQLRPALAELLG